MLRIGSALLVALLAWPVLVAAEGGVTPATMEKYRQVKEMVEKLPQTKAGEFAKETIEAAARSISAAQEGLKAGDEKATKEAVEMAGIQAVLAAVQAEEREAAKATAASRTELTRVEARLAAILAGKGDGQ